MRASSRAAPDGGRGGAVASSSSSPASSTSTSTSSPTSSSPTSSSSSFAVLRLLVPLLLLFVAAAVLPAPTRPSIMTDFFASRELGRGVQCGYSEGKNGDKKKNGDKNDENGGGNSTSVALACSRAHSSAAAAASLSDFFGNSLALLVAPAFGRASDVVVGVVGVGATDAAAAARGKSIFAARGFWGGSGSGSGSGRRRARFLSLALLSSALPPLTLFLHLSPFPSFFSFLFPWSSPISPFLYSYFLFSAVATAAPGAAVCLAYAADALPAGKRAPAFAAVSAAVSAGLLLGSGAGAFLSARTAAGLATTGVVASGVLAAWLPEVSPSSAAKRNTSLPSASSSSSFTPLSALRLLTATPQATRLLICVVLSGAAAQGLSDTIAQFLQQRLDFGARDQALLLAVAGGGGLLAQAVVLPLLLSWQVVAGEAGLLRVGLAASFLEHSLLVFSKTKAAALSAVGVGALGGLAFPAASALAADSGRSEEQGAVQGALSAARSGAAAVGPLAFGGIYFFSQRRWLPSSSSSPSPSPSSSSSSFFAGAPFVFGALLLLSALVLAMRIEGGVTGGAGLVAGRISSSGEGERTRENNGGDEEEAAPLMTTQRESES